MGRSIRGLTGPLMVADIVARGATAQRGHVASETAAGVAANVLALAGASVPVPGLNIALGMVGYGLGSSLAKPLQTFAEFGQSQRRLEFSAGFVDSQRAWTMRQRAAIEIGQSLLNARQYLGREALLMHQ